MKQTNKYLKECRLAAEVSAATLSDHLNITTSFLYQLERGEKAYPIELIIKAEEIIPVDIRHLSDCLVTDYKTKIKRLLKIK